MRELGYEFEKISQVTGRSMRQIRNAYKPVPMSPEDKYIYDVYGLGYEDDLTRAKKKARCEGEIKGRNDVIMNMYNLGYKSEEISRVTQKSVAEVEKIFKETREALLKNKDTVIVSIIPHDSCHDSLLVRELNEIQRQQEEIKRAKEDGYDEGEIETKTKIIKNMLLAEFKFEDIERLTDASTAEIIAIKNNLKI